MKILVTYDGSHIAKEALKFAQKHAKAFGAKLEVVNTITRHVPLEYNDIQVVEQDLAHGVGKILSDDELPYETHVLLSDKSSGEQLVNYAKVYNIDEIIIGVKKRSKNGALYFGSTAQHVVLKAPCPVITLN
jgi:nucleotide-binding universal stress UspA family protein